ILGDSDINVSYVNNYRTTFGLGANPPIVVVDGNDPGVTDDAYIAYKQIELIGAAGCEIPGTAGSAGTGYAVNGYATSPFVTAVGGTDFYYGTTKTTTAGN